MAMSLQDLDVAVQANASAVTDAKNDLDAFKTELTAANGRLAAEIKRLTDLLAASGGSVDTTPFVDALGQHKTVLEGISTDLKALTTSETGL